MPTMGNDALAGRAGFAGPSVWAGFFGRRFKAGFGFMIPFRMLAESDSGAVCPSVEPARRESSRIGAPESDVTKNDATLAQAVYGVNTP